MGQQKNKTQIKKYNRRKRCTRYRVHLYLLLVRILLYQCIIPELRVVLLPPPQISAQAVQINSGRHEYQLHHRIKSHHPDIAPRPSYRSSHRPPGGLRAFRAMRVRVRRRMG